MFARVGPSETRKLTTGDAAAQVLVLGGVPGQPFEVTQFTEEGAPDPLAAPHDLSRWRTSPSNGSRTSRRSSAAAFGAHVPDSG